MRKKLVCVILTIALMFASSFSVYWVTQKSVLYKEIIAELIFHKNTDLSSFSLKQFYSKNSSVYTERYMQKFYINDMQEFLSVAGNDESIIVRAKYLGRKTNSQLLDRAEFKFEVCEVLLNTSTRKISAGDKIQYHQVHVEDQYYTTTDFVHYKYSVGYEKGEEYLLVLNDFTSTYVVPNFEESYGFVSVNKLTGEYPYIELCPGPVRYDATYFGAESKYVTPEQFIKLFMEALPGYEKDQKNDGVREEQRCGGVEDSI